LTNAYWPTDSDLLPAHNVKECGEAITAIKEALAQTEPNYKKALEVWLDKTEWVQETVKPHELGMHRADVLKQRIEEALAQPEQDGECKRCTDGCPACDARKLSEQEPVAFVKGWNCGRLEVIVRSLNQRFEIDQPLYTTPPQRTWVTLTEDEIVLISADCAATHQHTDIHFAKAIENKLRELNT
jgi:hypothetical protein